MKKSEEKVYTLNINLNLSPSIDLLKNLPIQEIINSLSKVSVEVVNEDKEKEEDKTEEKLKKEVEI